MAQEIIKTEDVVEILDTRILTSQAHAAIGILMYTNYSLVLDALEFLICSPEQKEALNSALTEPGALNPVVLMDDIPSYYPTDDLGGFKDAVVLAVDLPSAGNTLNDMRPVLSENAIYRWTGTAWEAFISTGTIYHDMLSTGTMNDDTDHVHLTQAQKNMLLSQSHEHTSIDSTNMVILESITTAGSGIIISDDERLRLPTVEISPGRDEKAAMVGTVSPVSASNRYVTSVDPRLNTIKNPYYTFGPLGSLSTYMGEDVDDFDTAFAGILAITFGPDYEEQMRSQPVLEMLPGEVGVSPTFLHRSYELNAGANLWGLQWSDDSPFLFEALACRESVLEMSPDGVGFYIADGTGRVTVRGLTLDVSNLAGTPVGIALLERDYTIFEDCTFTTSFACDGVRIAASQCTLLRCDFTGIPATGVVVNGDDCRIQTCIFDVPDGLLVQADGCQVSGCTFIDSTIEVAAGVSDTIFDSNRLTGTTAMTDGGTNTIWRTLLPQTFASPVQHPYVGASKTVGPAGSFADFRGDDQTPFISAMADPLTTRIEVLAGTYVFASPVAITDGYSFHGVNRTSVVIQGDHCFSMGENTRLSNMMLEFNGVSSAGIICTADASEVADCLLHTTGAEAAVSLAGATNFKMSGCVVTGTMGVDAVSAEGASITRNLFKSTAATITTDAATTGLLYADNVEESASCSLLCDQSIVRGNHFLVPPIPLKPSVTRSLWAGNYPLAANNGQGAYLALSAFMEPVIDTGSDVSSFLGTASISFLETGLPDAVSSQEILGDTIDQSEGYTLSLFWTSSVYSNDVLWEVTTVFRDRDTWELGAPVTKTAVSTRTKIVSRQEDRLDVAFLNTEYGGIVNPSHVGIRIRRLGDDLSDTFPGIAYLTEAVLTLKRLNVTP